jgi:hypothetical protein
MTTDSPFTRMLKKCGGNPTIEGLLSGMLALDTPDEIRVFARDYELWLVGNGDDTIKGKEIETARRNLGYIIGYCDAADRKKLYSALNDITHPIFGPSFGRV